MSKKNRSWLDELLSPPKHSPFANPSRRNTAKVVKKNDSNGGSTYWGGRRGPLDVGHGHSSKNHPSPARQPVSDFLGNTAIRGSGGGYADRSRTPRWGQQPGKKR